MRQKSINTTRNHFVEIKEATRLAMLQLAAAFPSIEVANQELYSMTGIRRFFTGVAELQDFCHVISHYNEDQHLSKRREWGDFQTPPSLATRICQYLVDNGVSPQVIVEPTFGQGNFIFAALEAFPEVELIYGVEIQQKYEWRFKVAALANALEVSNKRHILPELELYRDDIFTHHFDGRISSAHNILILGNPPWVTNTELGSLNAQNVPTKSNVKSLSGMDAITGKSNFDLGEFVLLQLLDQFSNQHGTLAMLCKNSVIKNIVELLPRRGYSISNIRALEINAQREFAASVDASLLVMDIGRPQAQPTLTCNVTTLDDPELLNRSFGWVEDKFVSNIREYHLTAQIDGKFPVMWRQGVKHDCAQVMELTVREKELVNGSGEYVEVEEQYLYSLLKSSDLQAPMPTQPRKKVIITHKRIGEDTLKLARTAPKLWGYLLTHKAVFDKRGSSIYQDKPPFSIFGIGEYSFAPYKVAVSGLYKEPHFSLVCPIDKRPVILDDTCYFIGFDTYLKALFTASLLNTSLVKRFLKSIAFVDAKRPYTKAVLMRIDLVKVASYVSFTELLAVCREMGCDLATPILERAYNEFVTESSIFRSIESAQALGTTQTDYRQASFDLA